MRVTQKTFLQRLQYLQAELRAITQSPEIRELIQGGYYDPDINLIDAMQAVTETINAYEEMYSESQNRF